MINFKTFGIFLTIFLIFLGFGYFFLNKVNNAEEISKIKVGTKDYNLYISKTSQQLEKGLARFDEIKDNEGMIFIFDTPGTYSFWMKDMKFNIDIIFLDENKKVVNIFPNVKFDTYKSPYDYENFKPDYESKYVIELKEGEIKANGIKVGDMVEFSLQ